MRTATKNSGSEVANSKDVAHLLIVEVPDVAAVVAGLPVLPREEGVGHVPPLLHCPVRQSLRPEEQLQLD
jgi:hypothetical protein